MTATRGRPKTLNRQKTLDVAMLAYWQDGISAVSLNEICRRAAISKPGLYREFGGEDGLMQAVLAHYQHHVLEEMLQILDTQKSLRDTLIALVTLVTQVNNSEAPKGCLLIKMRDVRLHLGEATQQQIDETCQYQLEAFTQWLEYLAKQGEYKSTITPAFAATYIVAPLSQALTQIALGEDSETVKAILTTAFSVLQ